MASSENYNLVKYIKIFHSYLGFRMYLVMVLTIAGAILEGFGIMMLLPLLEYARIGQEFGVASTELSGISIFIGGIFESFGLLLDFSKLTMLLAFIFFLKGLVSFGSFSLVSIIKGRLIYLLKVGLYKDLTNVSYKDFQHNSQGYYVNILNEQTNRSLLAFQFLSNMNLQLVNFIVFSSLAFSMSFSFGVLVVLCVFPILMIFRTLNAKVRQSSRVMGEESGTYSNFIIERTESFKYLRATNKESLLDKITLKSVQILSSMQARMGVMAALTQGMREPLTVVIILGIIFYQVTYNGQNMDSIIVLVALFYKALNAILGIQGNWQHVLEHVGGLELIHEFRNGLRSRIRKEFTPSTRVDGGNKIEFKDVFFKHERGSQDLFNKLSFSIEKNEIIALIGRSGSGKTTVLDLILGLYPISGGSICIDGKTLTKEELEDFRDSVGYVPQSPRLFNLTIAGNIALPLDDKEIDKEKIIQVAKKASIHNDIIAMPDGYETMIGSKGVNLSGGQIQRIAIARELYKSPKLLILDEATSALDYATERDVHKTLDKLKGKITIIIVAHRLNTLSDTYRLFVFKNGEIVESGNMSDLMDMPSSEFNSILKQGIE